jgi:hypothetical protein
MTKVRVLLGVLVVLVLVGSATGCGLVSDQTKQEAKKKVESKAQQAKPEGEEVVAGRPNLPLDVRLDGRVERRSYPYRTRHPRRPW